MRKNINSSNKSASIKTKAVEAATMLTNEQTPLQMMSDALVNTKDKYLFPNQTAMFSILIDVKKYNFHVNNGNFKALLSNPVFNPNSKESREIYSSIHYSSSSDDGKKKNDNEKDNKKDVVKKEDIVEKIPPRPFKEENIAHNKSNCNSCIHGTKEIPKDWQENYLISFGNEICCIDYIKKNYFTPLGYMLQYYLLLSGNKLTRKEVSPDRKEDDYIEYITIPEAEWNGLVDRLNDSGILELVSEDADNLKEDPRPIRRLVKIFYNTLVKHIDRQNAILFDEKKRIINVEKERRFYEDYINCYGYKTIDRFNALQANCLTNIFCAYDLARIYYYGDVFYSVSCEFSIEKNREAAWDCYLMCVKHIPKRQIIDDPRLKYALNSLGEMAIKKMLAGEMSFEDGFRHAKDDFERCLKDGTYASARHNLGRLYRIIGERELEKWDQKSPLSDDIIKNFEEFLNYTFQASEENYIYSYNALAHFLMSSKYEAVRNDSRIFDLIVEKNLILDNLLEKSAEGKNPWGLDWLANRYRGLQYSATRLSAPDRLKKAEMLYLEAFHQNYVWSAYHLIVHRYFKEITEDYLHAVDLVCKYFNSDDEEFKTVAGMLIDAEEEIDGKGAMRRYVSSKKKTI